MYLLLWFVRVKIDRKGFGVEGLYYMYMGFGVIEVCNNIDY